MVSLIKLFKGMVFTALLSKTVRGTLISTVMKSIGRILRPSTVLSAGAFIAALLNQRKIADQPSCKPKNFQTLLENTLASMLLKSTKGRGVTFTEEEATSAISAIMATLMRSVEGFAAEGRQDKKSLIIESNDYSVDCEK